MTGFIRGLFGSEKSQPVEASAPAKKVERQPQEKESKAFFLEMNEARTYGDLEYMQASKKVKRTFPKTLDQPEEQEFVQEVSAMDRVVEGKAATASSAMPLAEPQQQNSTASSSDEAVERRRMDTSMDMFRNMAKQIRK
jgi:hypothetical protein